MKRIAVIGTGIAGLGAGYYLKDHCDITFFERNGYPGGHTNTLTMDEDGRDVYIDSGFMVYNDVTYPHLVKLFDELKVETKPTRMSFSVQHAPSGLEFSGSGLNGLFAQRKNFFNPFHIRMLLEISRFRKESVRLLENDEPVEEDLDSFVRGRGYSENFIHKFLIPMSSAVWSTEPGKMLQFPAITLIWFFHNHGFLGLNTQLKWRTVVEGSHRYRDKILSFFPGKLKTNTSIRAVTREAGQVRVTDDKGNTMSFDQVIIASHADEALRMLSAPTPMERELLSAFTYQKNYILLHKDENVMPRTRRAWASWNYRIKDKAPTTIYWMNSLQQVSKHYNYFISVNDQGEVDPSKVLWETHYDHPVYSLKSMSAQKRLQQLNQNGRVYFCGSYFNYGFHEDALKAGKDVTEMILAKEK